MALDQANPPPHRPARSERAIGVAMLLLLLAGSLTVLRPFIWALVWAIVLSFALWPVHRWLVGWLRGRSTLAAFLITVAIAAALVVPLTITVANLADDARELAVAGRGWLQSGLPASPSWVGKIPLVGHRAAGFWDELVTELRDASADASVAPDMGPATGPATVPSTEPNEHPRMIQTLQALISWVKTAAVGFGLAVGEGVMQVALSLFFLFFILKDGEALGQRLRAGVHRVSGSRGGQLLDVAGGTVRGVIYGILGTALVQGIMAGIGFFIAGVPGAALLGLLTFVFSPVPLGPVLIWVPAVIWLFHRGTPSWGVFMLVWGMGVSTIDNVVKPWLISRGSSLPFVVIFFGVVGGAMAFGLIGVFIGPTLLAVVYRLIDEWSRPHDSFGGVMKASGSQTA